MPCQPGIDHQTAPENAASTSPEHSSSATAAENAASSMPEGKDWDEWMEGYERKHTRLPGTPSR